MSVILFILVCIGAAIALGMQRAPLWAWAAFVAAVTLLIQMSVPWGTLAAPSLGVLTLLGWIPAIVLGLLAYHPIRQKVLTTPLYGLVKRVLPPVSDTEKEALEAGTVGFEADLFSGAPDWEKLRAVRPMTLTSEERQFLDGPVEELCRRLDDWHMRRELREIPAEVWDFVAQKGFFGMLISKQHGGLGFSAQAQSLIIGKIASRSPDVAVLVLVPNSLGPGELIEKFGTDEQKEHYLPRLARGHEIPCFALTSPFAGSDAASMRDIGIVTKGQFNGGETLGVRLSWDKRYITLAPNATLLGLAFRLFDPDNLLGKGEDVGITVALVPTSHKGVVIGARHLPCGNAFPNGPTWGKDVFIPLDWIVGGAGRAGQGWRMLMSCLAAGRAITLPSASTAGAKMMLRVTSAYARVRKQFSIPIGRMEGIEERLARLVEAAYLLEAGRSVTASMVSGGEKPAVISAIMKYQSTEWNRQAVSDAMDIHGGKAICDGPSNYLQSAYQMIPVGITVEGANILTRNLITFAQGALRAHPWLFKEIEAAQHENQEEGFKAFEHAFENHAAFAVSNLFGAFFHNITFGLLGAAPPSTAAAAWYRQLYRGSRNFALVADMTVSLLGGGLKVKQRITGRLADALSELYLLACLLKRYEDDGQPEADRPILDYCAQNCLHRFYAALKEVLGNFPVRAAGPILKIFVFPFGVPFRPAKDALGKEIVRLVLEPGEVRDRLTREIYVSHSPDNPTGALETAFSKAAEVEEADRKIEKAAREGKIRRFLGKDWFAEAVEKGVVTVDEAEMLRQHEALIAKVIGVDHFDQAGIAPKMTAKEAARPDDGGRTGGAVAPGEAQLQEDSAPAREAGPDQERGRHSPREERPTQ